MKSWFESDSADMQSVNMYGYSDAPALDNELDAFLKNLRLLGPVPISYLVPNAETLPMETLAVFYVDEDWVNCLVDGALSIGRNSSKDYIHDRTVFDQYMPKTNRCRFGFILRSEIVSGWPGLQAECFGQDEKTPVSVLRLERLEESILLCITEQPFSRLTLIQPQEGLHFGFKYGKNGRLVQKLKSLSSDPNRFCKPLKAEVEASFRPGEHQGVLRILETDKTTESSGLVGDIKKKLKETNDNGKYFSSLEFAVQMLDLQQSFTIDLRWEQWR